MSRQHMLKVWPEFFAAILEGRKRFEWRKEDGRRFEVGHTLLLREFDPNAGVYTGLETTMLVTFILRGEFEVTPGYVVLSIEPIGSTPAPSKGTP